MMTNYINEYYQKIKDGSIIAGHWVIRLYEIIQEGLQKKSFFYDAKKASRAIKFIENYCHHSKGRNDLLKLELWQKALVSVIFGIVDENGNRQFREVVLIIARKNGKSLFASAIIAYMTYLDGEYKEENVEIIVSMSVKGKYQDTEHVKFKTLPPVKVASCIVKGCYHQMGEAYATVVSWIKDNGYKINGPMFNIYHVGPVQTQNPNEFVTEACFPVE